MPRLPRIVLIATATLIALAGCTLVTLPNASSPSPSISASPSPSVTPEPELTAPIEPRVTCDQAADQAPPPAGGIALSQLCAATIDLPTWSDPACPAGPQTFTDGAVATAHLNDGSASLPSDSAVAYVDIDHDGQAETILLVSCGTGGEWSSQVVALRAAPDGSIVTLAPIIATDATVRRIFTVDQAATTGVVRVWVGDYNAGVGGDDSIAQVQQREFSWTDGGFHQSDGPTSFPANPRLVPLSVTAGPLTFGPVRLQQRTGTAAITVHNQGPASADYTLTVTLPAGVRLIPTLGCDVVKSGDPVEITCTGTVAAAGAQELDLTLTAPPTFDPSGESYASLATVAVAAGFADPDEADNTTSIRVTLA